MTFHLPIATPNVSELEVLSSDSFADIPISARSDRLTISGNSDAVFDLRESCGLEIAMVRA